MGFARQWVDWVHVNWCGVCCLAYCQVDVTSKTEGKVDNSHMLVKYDARLRDNVAVGVVQEVTDTVQVRMDGALVVCSRLSGNTAATTGCR